MTMRPTSRQPNRLQLQVGHLSVLQRLQVIHHRFLREPIMTAMLAVDQEGGEDPDEDKEGLPEIEEEGEEGASQCEDVEDNHI